MHSYSSQILKEFNKIYPYFNIIEHLCGADKKNVYNEQFWKDMSKFKNCVVNNLYSNIGPTMETPQSAIKGLQALQLMEKYEIIRNDTHRKTHSSKYSVIFENLNVEINNFHEQLKVM